MICVDASVAIKWILWEENADKARQLLRTTLDSEDSVVAPPLLPFEIVNALRQRVRSNELSPQDAHERLSDFLQIPLSIWISTHMYYRALRIAEHFSLPAAYDAHYIALAQLLETDLWTDDQRLLRLLDGAFPFVRPIADYAQRTT